MSASRVLSLSSKLRSRVASGLLQRFGPSSRRIHSSNYSKSSRYNNERRVTTNPSGTEAPRSARDYLLPAFVVGVFAGGALLFHYNDERRVVLKGQKRPDFDPCLCHQTYRQLKPVMLMPFKLIDTEHRVVTEKSFLGNWVLLYFGYTSSPDVGPEELSVVAKATDILESKQDEKILPVFVTIDPQRDNPSHLRAYLKEFDSRIVGLTGPVTAIRHMAQEYRVFFKKVEEDRDDYLIETSHNKYLLNPKMEIVSCYGTEYSAEELSEEILKEINRDSN